MSDRMNDRIEELLKMLGDVDDFNREIIEIGRASCRERV